MSGGYVKQLQKHIIVTVFCFVVLLLQKSTCLLWLHRKLHVYALFIVSNVGSVMTVDSCCFVSHVLIFHALLCHVSFKFSCVFS